MALREIRDIRPHLVLEGSFKPKTFWRQERERRARVLEIVGDWCESLHVFSRLLKKKARASKDKKFKV